MTEHRPRAESLAQGFVEATTEWDFADLPVDLRDDLIACAGRLIAFADRRVVIAGSTTEERIVERGVPALPLSDDWRWYSDRMAAGWGGPDADVGNPPD